MTADGDKLAAFERGNAIEVPVGRIEAELAALSPRSTAPSRSAPTPPTTRASRRP